LELPAFSVHFEAFGDCPTREKKPTPETKAWIWIHKAIMRDAGEIIGKLGEGIFKSVFSGLG